MGHNNSHGIKIFDDTVYEGMKAAVPRCTSLIAQCNKGDGPVSEFACQSAFVVCNMALTSPYRTYLGSIYYSSNNNVRVLSHTRMHIFQRRPDSTRMTFASSAKNRLYATTFPM